MTDYSVPGIDAWCDLCKAPLGKPHDEAIHRAHRDEQLSVFPDWVAPPD
jgi:hypothetical protein